ncbi:hypothetical protein NDU88_005162 [Pleurodeles waltl]|uniref:Uncharacterized protein n=1 Tax=Pleurodeles waltl TaxID=8319 RepID=A0AAV7M9Q7_PLEWA|nr:hypothetical protein NDU88_005162 [Pleurodeles waltl]
MVNEDARLDSGGGFKPTTSSSEEMTDSLETAGRKTPTKDSLETAGRKTQMTAVEQQTEDNGGAQIPEEMTTRSFPDGRCEEQEVAKRSDRPRSGKSVA